MGTPLLRDSTEDDLAAIVAVNDRAWRAATGLHHPLTVERLRVTRTVDGRVEGTDDPVVEVDGAVEAWGALWAFAPYSQLFLALAVDPDLDDATHDACVGLLVEHGMAVGRARLESLGVPDDPSRTFSTEVVHADERLRDAVVRRGFVFTRHELEMAIDLDAQEVVLTDVPDGVRVRVVDPERDSLAVAAVLREAFLDHHGDSPFTDTIVDEQLREDARPDATFVAEDDEGVVGALISRDRGENGYVWAIGVARRARRQGLAAAMLTRALASFAAAGRHLVTLDVDASSLTGATRVYERVGMSTRVVRDEFVRPLAAD